MIGTCSSRDKAAVDRRPKVFHVNAREAAALDFALWSKNFINFPVARSRAGARWREKRGAWVCGLHRDRDGDPRIKLRLPVCNRRGHRLVPRAPNVGDLEVAMRLCAMGLMAQRDQIHALAFEGKGKRAIDRKQVARRESRREVEKVLGEYQRGEIGREDFAIALGHHADYFGKADGEEGSERTAGRQGYRSAVHHFQDHRKRLRPVVLEFRSLRALLVALGRSDFGHEARVGVRRSVNLLRRLGIEHRQWRSESGDRTAVILPPLVSRVEWPAQARQPLRIAIAPEFLIALQRYSQRVPLPLHVPMTSPATFNLLLLLENWLETFRDDKGRIFQRPSRTVACRIGIPPGPRWRQRLAMKRVIESIERCRPGRFDLHLREDGQFVGRFITNGARHMPQPSDKPIDLFKRKLRQVVREGRRRRERM